MAWMGYLTISVAMFVAEIFFKKTIEKLLEPYIPSRNRAFSMINKTIRLAIVAGLPILLFIHLMTSYEEVNKAFILSLSILYVIVVINIATILVRIFGKRQVKMFETMLLMKKEQAELNRMMAERLKETAVQVGEIIGHK